MAIARNFFTGRGTIPNEEPDRLPRVMRDRRRVIQ
jgi:hypothetical protein